MWDTIVIGSGIGGLAAAAALAEHQRGVLVLEQHSVAGGLTHTFQRGEWNFSTGVHTIGGVGPHPGPEGLFGRVLAHMSKGTLLFKESANPYDVIRLPGFEFAIAHPENAYRADLHARFGAQHAAIDEWFTACDAARRSAFTLFAMHSLPALMTWGLHLWRGAEVEHWTRHTLAAQLGKVADPQLRAVLGARWGTYGAPPEQAPFVEHVLVTGSYNGGAYYPAGGPARFAQTLTPVIEAAGGAVRVGAEVTHIVTEHGRAVGVDYEHRGERRREMARHVISAMGAANTVACLGPHEAPQWQETIRAFEPGLAYVSLFLGFEGDIAAGGASSANHWIFESDDIGAVWHTPADSDAPGIFVNFPSLKDPLHHGKPTGEVVAMCDASAFAPWLKLPLQLDAARPDDYLTFKARVQARLLAQVQRHFPKLTPLLRFHEMSTPLTQRHYTRAVAGATYGIEMSAERLTTPALHVRTPIPGLLLAGQDVTSPGIQGAFMGGLMAAAAIEPKVWAGLRG